jgi:magnesium chelatase family protein
VVARANAHVTYPCKFLLIAAANPCRCGNLYDANAACNRAPICGQDYLGKISGPLMDRFDLRLEVPPVSYADLDLPASGETSAAIAARVAAARGLQAERFAALGSSALVHADAEGALLDEIATPDPAGKTMLLQAAETFKLTARGYHRVLRLARTIADLEGDETINTPHIAEAVGYRLVGTRES